MEKYLYKPTNGNGLSQRWRQNPKLMFISVGILIIALILLFVQLTNDSTNISTEIISREEWGARPIDYNSKGETGVYSKSNPNGIFTYRNPKKELNTIVIHHSATQGLGVKKIQDIHMDGRGYADIAYHFVIDKDGKIYEGRAINIRGSHTASYNTGSIGIVLLGNFEESEPSDEQLKVLEPLVSDLKSKYDISYLSAHSDYPKSNGGTTECPGANLAPQLPKLAEKVDLEYGIQGYSHA